MKQRNINNEPVNQVEKNGQQSEAKTTKKTNKNIVGLTVLGIATAGVVGVSAGVYMHNNAYAKMAEEWDRKYGNGVYTYHEVSNINGKIVCEMPRVEDDFVLSPQQVSENPKWVEEGLEEAGKNIKSEKALFAAKLYTIAPDTWYYEECLAFGVALFENPANCTTSQLAICQDSLCWYMVN